MLGLCWRGEMFAMKRNMTFLFTSIVSLVAVILLATSIATDEWVRSDLKRILNVNNNNGNVTYRVAIEGGYKHFGLFHGCEEKQFGTHTDPRKRCFNALVEVEALCDVHMVYGTLVGLTAATFFLLVAIQISLYIECVKDVKEILETTTIYFIYICAGLTSVAASSLYGIMYHTNFRHTVLTPLDINQGFSSETVYLGVSYWLIPAASCLIVFNLIVLCCVNIRTGKSSCFNPDFTRKCQASEFPVKKKVPEADRSTGRADMMMY